MRQWAVVTQELANRGYAEDPQCVGSLFLLPGCLSSGDCLGPSQLKLFVREEPVVDQAKQFAVCENCGAVVDLQAMIVVARG